MRVFKQYIKWNGRELEAMILGFIAGVAFCIVLYVWYIEPGLIKEWEERAIKAKVAEYYEEDNIQKFRYLTEKLDE